MYPEPVVRALFRERERAGEWAAYAEQLTSFVDSPSGGGMKGDPIWEDLKKEAPVAILDRLKTRWQVEVLEDAQASLMLRGDDREALRLMIETTRRQAGGDES